MKHAGTRQVLGFFLVNFPSHVRGEISTVIQNTVRHVTYILLQELAPRITLLAEFSMFGLNMTWQSGDV